MAKPQFINPYRRFYGAMVPNWLMERPEVSPGGKLCYARLAAISGARGECWPTQEELSTLLAVSERQVRRYLSELINTELVTEEQQGLNQPNLYRFLWHRWMDDDSLGGTGDEDTGETTPPDMDTVSGPDRTDMSTPDRTDMSGQSGHKRPVLTLSKTHKKIQMVDPKIEVEEGRQKGGEVPKGFQRFWEDYPQTHRKAERMKCLGHWRTHKLEEHSTDVLKSLNSWKRSREWSEDDGKYIPAPLVWLRKAPWESPAPRPSSNDSSARPPLTRTVIWNENS